MSARTLGVDEIERRAQEVLSAVNAEGSPLGRMMAWGGAAILLREDVPALVATVRALYDSLDSAPIRLVDESAEAFVDRYAKWYRHDRRAAIAKAKGK
jgi:hypothetical protein